MRSNDGIPELIHCRPCASCNPLYTTRQPLFTLSNRLCVSCRPLLVLRTRPCSLPSPGLTLRNPLFTLHNRLCVTLIPFPTLRNSVRAPHKSAFHVTFLSKKNYPKPQQNSQFRLQSRLFFKIIENIFPISQNQLQLMVWNRILIQFRLGS